MTIRFGLRGKVTLGISVVIISTVAFLSSYLIQESWNRAYEALIFQSKSLAASMSFQASTLIESIGINFDDLSDNLDHHSFVAGLHIFDDQRNPLYVSEMPKIRLPDQIINSLYPDEFSREPIDVDSKSDESFIYLSMPIFKQTNYFTQGTLTPNRYTITDIQGYLVLIISTDQLMTDHLKTLETLIWLTLGVILVGILGSVLLTGSFIQPIIELVKATKIVAGGDYTFRSKITSKDEIGLLTASFNNMTAEIQSFTNRLNDYSKHLEDKVSERTAELQKSNTKIQRALKKVTESNRLKSEFLSNISHELRTPLNAIIGFSDLLLAKIDGPLTDSQQKDLTLINQSGHHLLTLINGLLDIAKIESGHVSLQLSQVDIPKLVRSVIDISQALISDKPIILQADIPDSIPFLVADQLKLNQIILNLVSNAIKFTESGSITIRVSVTQTDMIFEIQDTGIGLKKSDQAKIFKKFLQVDGSVTRRSGGTGIGLSLVKEMAQLHQGNVWVESQLHKGSSFFISIPLNLST